jgi:ABC-type spermidine/putrescine transport system permease subunit II
MNDRNHLTIPSLYLVFLLLPWIIVIAESFVSTSFIGGTWGTPTLRWYAKAFTSQAWAQAFVNSAVYCTAAASLATLVGGGLAMGAHMAERRELQVVLYSVSSLPILIPPAITGLAIESTYGDWVPSSVLVPISLSLLGTPIAFILCSTALSDLGERTVWAAQTLGATTYEAYRRIAIPQITDSLFVGWLLALFMALDSVVLPLLLGTISDQTLAEKVWTTLQQDASPVAVSASVIWLTSVVILLLTNRHRLYYILFPNIK